MGTQDPKIQNLLRLDHIKLKDVPNQEYMLSLLVEDAEIELMRRSNRTWTPAQRHEVSPTSQIRAVVRMKSGHSFWVKYREAYKDIDLDGLFNDYWSSSNRQFTLLNAVVIGKYSVSLEVQFSADEPFEALRSSLHELEELLKEYNPLVIVSRQSNNDQMPWGFFDRLLRLLPLVKQVADQITSEETGILKDLIPRMVEVMRRAAKISCYHVRHTRIIGPAYLKKVGEIDSDLTNITDDFNRAMNLEALRLANVTKRTEWDRAEREQGERGQGERERAERERAEHERAEHERVERERAERERAERERLERAERERLEQEQEQAERERSELERVERERAERERERVELERVELERAERKRAERKRLERERGEQVGERGEQERTEQERVEQDNETKRNY